MRLHLTPLRCARCAAAEAQAVGRQHGKELAMKRFCLVVAITVILYIVANAPIQITRAQESTLCGWVDFAPPGTGVLELILTLENGERFSLLLLEEPFFYQIMSLDPPGYFRISDPRFAQHSDGSIDSMAIAGWSSIEKVETCNTSLPIPTSPVLCGQCRFIRYENPPGIGWSYYICTTSDNHLLAISGLPSDGYYQISNAVIDWSPIVLPDKTRIEGRITSWSNYERVESCRPFQSPTSTPTSVPAPTPTKTPIPTLAPPGIKITNFTLADTLKDFSQFQEPVILKPNTLWIQITNTGQAPFNPPSDGGKYIVQVVLKRTGIGKVEEYDYASGQSGLTPLGGLEPGENVVVHISDLFFFTPVDNAELEVFFYPDPSLGIKDSILSKPITIRDHPDTFQRCAATIAQSLIKVAKVAFPQYRAALRSADLAVRIVKCSSNSNCVAKETAIWLFGLVVGSIKDVGQVITIGADALRAMGENGPPPCIKVTDWLNAYLHEAIRNKFNVNGVAAESPVYPLVTNEAGQRSGFLENGQMAEEIPGSKVVVIGEQKFILYPGNGVSQLSLVGYAEGKMNLYTTYAQEPGQGISIRYSDVTITQGMKATLDLSDTQYTLKIDTNGDGNIDQSLLPNEILILTESGVSQQPIVPQQPKGICGSVFGLLALPILVIWIQRRGKDK